MKLIHLISMIGLGFLSIFPVVKVINLSDYAIAQNTDITNNQSLDAIVPLKDLNIPPATVTGETTVNLQRLENSRVFTIPLNVGNIEGNFLLDTGASTTMIASKLVQQLGLVGTAIKSEELTSAVAGDDCEDMSAILHSLPLVKMNQVEVKQLQALEFTNTIIPQNLSGVLGMDVLRNFDLKINPKTQQLQLLKPSLLPENLQENAIILQEELGVMLAAVKINNQGDFTFMLDTGADLIFISQQLANQLRLNESGIEPIQIQGFCGLEDANYSVLENVAINQYQQQNLGVVILNSPSVLDLLGIDGILGQNFFQFYQQHWRFYSNSNNNKSAGSLILESDIESE
ncbi:MAG: retropepsin-like aspartic protease [Microcoleaceae cyanobacterium]